MNAGRGMTRESVYHLQAEYLVSALGCTVLKHILPLFLVGIFLRFGPGSTSGKVKRAGVDRPGKGVDVFVTLRYRKRFAASRGNQIQLRNPAVFSFSPGMTSGFVFSV